MKYLAIDTSGDYLAIVCKIEEKVYSTYKKMPGVKHSVTLMPLIEELLTSANVDLKNLDFFSCTQGPGSFTGIRVGVATIKGFADGLKKPILPVTTLEVISYSKVGRNLAVIDAKHDHYYAQGFDNGKVTFDAAYIDKDKLTELSKEYEIVANGPIDGFLQDSVDICQGLVNAIDSNLDRISTNIDDLHPFYLRLSQAEENRK